MANRPEIVSAITEYLWRETSEPRKKCEILSEDIVNLFLGDTTNNNDHERRAS